MTGNPRILMLSPNPQAKGPIPRHTPLLIEGLEELGSTVRRMNWGQSGEPESNLRKVRDRWRAIKPIQNALREFRPDLLIVKTAHDWKTFLRDYPLLRRTKGLVPTRIIQFHGSNPQRASSGPFRLATAALFRESAGVLVLSTEEQRGFQSLFPSARIEVVKNPFIPLERAEFKPRTLEGMHRPAKLLFVGRLLREKGVFEIIDALASVPDCTVVFAGEGPVRGEMEASARGLAVQDRIQYLGYVTGTDLAAAYADADALIFPSWNEGLPSVILEAMQASLPIITTQIRGAADYLEEGKGARFVPPRDAQTLAVCMKQLLADPQAMLRMGVVNRDALKAFKTGLVAAEYAEALQRIRAHS